MICPECLVEYVEGVEVCAECKVSLVDAEPLDLPLHEVTWVKLQPVTGQVYAEMVSEVLDKQNIPNYIKADWVESAFNISAVNLPGTLVTIYVPEDNQKEAEEILNNIVG